MYNSIGGDVEGSFRFWFLFIGCVLGMIVIYGFLFYFLEVLSKIFKEFYFEIVFYDDCIVNEIYEILEGY